MASQNVNSIPRHNRRLTEIKGKDWEEKKRVRPNASKALEILRGRKHERRRRGKAKSQERWEKPDDEQVEKRNGKGATIRIPARVKHARERARGLE